MGYGVPIRWRGRLLDLTVFAANGWLVPRLTALAEQAGESSLAYAAVLVLSVFLYAGGAGLKRRPLGQRLAGSPGPPTWAWILLFILLVMQLGLGMLSILLPLEMWGHQYPSLAPALQRPWMLVPALMMGSLPVVMTVRALVPAGAGSQVAYPAEREALADLALMVSAVVSLSIWDGMIVQSLAGRGPEGWAMSLLLLVLISVPFSMFYAAPRILFLAEDYRSPMTWIRMAGVMLPSVARMW